MTNIYFRIYAILSLSLILLAAFVVYLGPTEAKSLLGETGPIERASALGYFLCVGYMLLAGGRDFAKRRAYIIVLVTLFGCRELDFDKRFTTMGILRSRFYMSSEVPLLEKLVGLIVIALLLWAVINIVKNHLTSTLANLSKLNERAVGVLMIFVLLAVSKSIDGLARKLKPLGVETSQQVSFLASSVEEVMELGVPILMIAVFHSWRRSRTG
ncbi:MAG TPA: hypothetical protein DEX20_05850 [Halieaceae bacterium]|nr:hypothetical protein [Halieaceae bacterium]